MRLGARTLTVDPGDTVGWSVWEDGDLIESGQAPLWKFIDAVYDGITGTRYPEQKQLELVELVKGVKRFVVEDFRIYPWKCKDLAMDPVRTARGIGALQLIARLHGIDFILQGASTKKQAEGAGAAELFETPLDENRHANDAVRHGVFYFATKGKTAESVAVDHDAE